MARDRVPSASNLLLRGFLLVAGLALFLAGSYAAVRVAPASLNPEPGVQHTLTERVEYWATEEGHQEVLRPRTDTVEDTGDGLELVRELEGPHSPRGDEFAVEIGDRWKLAEEPAAHAAFPPTPPWEEPPETVYVGVPWQTEQGKTVGGYDDFQRLHEVQQDGLQLVKYEAREPNQFLVDGDVVWFRSAQRTALVEPVSGNVVDYHDEETLWKAPLDRPAILHELQPPRENREKVWQAVVEPTPAGQQQLAERAEASRDGHANDLLMIGLSAFLGGEALMFAGIAGRPKRWLGA